MQSDEGMPLHMPPSSVVSRGAAPTPPPPIVPEETAHPRAAHPHVEEALSYARQHPALSILGVAGVGLLGGLELAAGLLLGAGVSSLLLQKNGHGRTAPRARGDRVRRLLDRTPRELLKRGRAVVQAARGKIAPAEEISEPHAPTITHS